MNRKAFTLIELLVVIAIIAILAAILFPVFARVRAKAHQTQCISNLKQIALAIRMYATDSDDVLPYGRGGGTYWWKCSGKWGTNPASVSPLARYIDNDEVFLCPSQEKGFVNGAFHGIIANHFGTNSGSITSWCYGNKVLSKVARPTEIITFADGCGSGGGTGEYNSLNPWSWMNVDGASFWSNPVACRNVLPPTCSDFHFQGLTADPPFWPCRLNPVFPQANSFVARHNGKINCAFIDGHVKAMDLTTIATTAVASGTSWLVGWRYLEMGYTGQ